MCPTPSQPPKSSLAKHSLCVAQYITGAYFGTTEKKNVLLKQSSFHKTTLLCLPRWCLESAGLLR